MGKTERSNAGKSAGFQLATSNVQGKQDVNSALIRVKEPDRCDAEGHSCRCCFVVDPKGNPRQGDDHDGGDVSLCYKQTQSSLERERQTES